MELGGVSVYLAEISTPGRKGFFVSWQSASQQAAVVFAGLLGVGLNHWLSPEQMGDWGWRVPFLIGCMIVPVIFVIPPLAGGNTGIPGPQASSNPAGNRPFDQVRTFGIVIAGMALVVMATVSFYLITAYTPTFGKAELHLSDFECVAGHRVHGSLELLLVAGDGSVSDKIGRKPLLLAATILAILHRLPGIVVAGGDPELQPSADRRTLVVVPLRLVQRRDGGGPAPRSCPWKFVQLGFSWPTAWRPRPSVALPRAACTYLIHVLDNKAAPGIWLSGAAVLGLIAALVLFRGNKHELRTARAMPAEANRAQTKTPRPESGRLILRLSAETQAG